MKLIRYPDLVAKGVVNSRMTLKRLIDCQDFPPGVLITPNARAWDEGAVDAWIAARPAARKPSTTCASRGLMVEKKSRSARDSRLSEANSEFECLRYSAFALQSQPTIDPLRVRRLMGAGLPSAGGATIAPLVWDARA